MVSSPARWLYHQAGRFHCAGTASPKSKNRIPGTDVTLPSSINIVRIADTSRMDNPVSLTMMSICFGSFDRTLSTFSSGVIAGMPDGEKPFRLFHRHYRNDAPARVFPRRIPGYHAGLQSIDRTHLGGVCAPNCALHQPLTDTFSCIADKFFALPSFDLPFQSPQPANIGATIC